MNAYKERRICPAAPEYMDFVAWPRTVGEIEQAWLLRTQCRAAPGPFGELFGAISDGPLLLYAAPSSARVIPRQTASHRSHQAALRP